MSRAAGVIESWDSSQREIGLRLREAVLDAEEGLEEAVKWGSPTYSLRGTNLCSIVAHAEHVNLQLFLGADLAAFQAVLEGTGKKMRHLEYRSPEDVNASTVRALVRRSAEQI